MDCWTNLVEWKRTKIKVIVIVSTILFCFVGFAISWCGVYLQVELANFLGLFAILFLIEVGGIMLIISVMWFIGARSDRPFLLRTFACLIGIILSVHTVQLTNFLDLFGDPSGPPNYLGRHYLETPLLIVVGGIMLTHSVMWFIGALSDLPCLLKTVACLIVIIPFVYIVANYLDLFGDLSRCTANLLIVVGGIMLAISFMWFICAFMWFIGAGSDLPCLLKAFVCLIGIILFVYILYIVCMSIIFLPFLFDSC